MSLLASRTGYASGWAYANDRTQREFVLDFRAWYSTFMTPLKVVTDIVNSAFGGDEDGDSKQPKTPRQQRVKQSRKAVPPGAKVFDMGGKDEYPNPGALLAMRGLFNQGAEILSPHATQALIQAHQRGEQVLTQQEQAWRARRG